MSIVKHNEKHQKVNVNLQSGLKNIYPVFLIIFFLFIASTTTQAQYLDFVENKGQWDKAADFMSDFGGGAVFLKQNGYRVLLHDKADLEKIANYYGHGEKVGTLGKSFIQNEKLLLRSHVYEVNFLNALTNLKPEPEKYTGTYNNYFSGTDSSHWAGNCKIYNAVKYKNLYKNIDIRYYANEGQLKYDLVVNPGADLSQLALQFTGMDGLELNKTGNLVIKTSVGDAYELKPYVYQLVNGLKKKVAAKYDVDKAKKIIHFALDKYDKNSTLIIDPALIFATFTGSKSDNWGYTATYDNDGNFYAGGITFGKNYPASVGAYSTNFGGGDDMSDGLGGYDIAIMKFSSNGAQRMFATYLGSSGKEQPHSMIVDNAGNLIVSGRTSSKTFPQTKAPFGPGGDFDILISKLSADGSKLLSSILVGGTGSDGVNSTPKYSGNATVTATNRNYGDDARSEVITDRADNIFLASCTRSGNFPTTANAFDKSLSGNQDGVYMKLTPNMDVLASTYLGGNNEDAAFVLAINPFTSNVFIAGATSSKDFAKNGSSNGPIIFGNASPGGDGDGFVSELNQEGSSNFRTAYIGGPGADVIYGIQFDKLGLLYVMGTTTGTLQVINANFSQNGGKQFITKLSPDFSSVIYSTNFGSGRPEPDISPTAFLVDVCENVYVSGWGGKTNGGFSGGSTSGLTVTQDAIINFTDGSDFYFFVLNRDATNQLYGTFFGSDARKDPGTFGDHVDGGTSRFDKRGVIYQAVCANCGRAGTFPTTAGVWSPGNQAQEGSLCNEAAIKIAFQLTGVSADISSSINGIPRDTSGCVPLTVAFEDLVALGTSYEWDFGDGSPSVITTTQNTTHTFNTIGTFRVRLISTDLTKCYPKDTSYLNIKVGNNEAFPGFTNLRLPPCQDLSYQFTNTSIPPTGLSFNNTIFRWDFGDNTAPVTTNAATVNHQYAAPGIYNVKLFMTDPAFCNSPDSVTQQLRVAATLKANFITPLNGCVPYTASFINNSAGGQQFNWDFGDGSTSTDETPTHLYTSSGSYTIKLVVKDNSTCNPIDSIETVITVRSSPLASFSFTPSKDPLPINKPTTFINESSDGVRFFWDFGDGTTLLSSSKIEPIVHQYGVGGKYKACLTVTSSFGCTDDTCQEVGTAVNAVVDVPNAFTPNGDGVNDYVRVFAFGVKSMNWRIFNRFGQLVFQTTDMNAIWDGTFEGEAQPQEVYSYVLDLLFFGKDKPEQKRGDITLLR